MIVFQLTQVGDGQCLRGVVVVELVPVVSPVADVVAGVSVEPVVHVHITWDNVTKLDEDVSPRTRLNVQSHPTPQASSHITRVCEGSERAQHSAPRWPQHTITN